MFKIIYFDSAVHVFADPLSSTNEILVESRNKACRASPRKSEFTVKSNYLFKKNLLQRDPTGLSYCGNSDSDCIIVQGKRYIFYL